MNKLEWLNQACKGCDKESLNELAKLNFSTLYEKSIGIVTGKGKGIGKSGHTNALYARLKVELQRACDLEIEDSLKTKIEVTWFPYNVANYLNKLGYIFIEASSNANDEEMPQNHLTLSEYYQHAVTKKLVRVSDHKPVNQRSLNADVFLQPNSFKSDGDALKALIDNAQIITNKDRAKIFEMNNLLNKLSDDNEKTSEIKQ